MSNISLNMKASFFVFIGRMSERLIGLVSTLILARLLMPDDFGLVALVWLVLRLLDALAVTGAQEYIVQKESITDDDINTAWTINLALKTLVVVVLIIAAPYIAAYYDEPKLELAIPVLSLVMVQSALVNPYIFQLKRERKYERLFINDLWAKAVSATVTIGLAFSLKSYWALIVGHLASDFVSLFLSYYAFSYRPKLSLRKLTEQFAFSQWMFLRGIFGYCRAYLDTFLVSQQFGIATLGGYHVSRYVAMMPGTDVIGPAMEPLFASFSSVQNDREKLRYQVSFALLGLLALALPITAFMFVNANEISTLLLGSKWVEFIPVFSILSLAVITAPLYNFCTSILYVLKQTKRAFFFDVFTLVGLGLLLILAPISHVIQFAWWKTMFDIVCVTGLLIYVLWQIGLDSIVRTLVFIGTTTLFVFSTGYYVSEFVGDDLNSLVSLAIEGLICLILLLIYYQVVFQIFIRKKTIGFHIKHLEKQHLKGFRFFSII